MADNCPFIHVQKYENQDIPEDELAQIVEKNRRENLMTSIKKFYP